jgi:succinate dehydrogenase/fumarate reductase flavoprotein subunit
VKIGATVPTTATDVLVLGTGLAGYRAATTARALGRDVVLVGRGRGASPYVIGCNAPFGHADDRDSPEQYYQDMLAGGSDLNDPRLVRALVSAAKESVLDLDRIGTPLVKDGDRFGQRQLAGNWYPRSVYHPDGFGGVALKSLARHSREEGVDVRSGWTVLSLLVDRGEACGALLFHPTRGEFAAVTAGSLVIALGGLGQLYANSTYPADVSSDSYALALEAGATLVDMEFVQFEPLVVFDPPGLAGLELPTAMLADGARLLNRDGERFMFRYNPEWGEARIEKAKLSLFIQQEIDEGRGLPGGGVLYDATQVPRDKLESYVRHCQQLRKFGIEPTSQGIPVRPAAHSQMGGIAIDEHGFTGVPGLFAAGEATGGLHGASRIAGNGGSDAVVFGGITGRSAAKAAGVERHCRTALPNALESIKVKSRRGGNRTPGEARAEIQAIMAQSAGLHRRAADLKAGLEQLGATEASLVDGMLYEGAKGLVAAIEARNMILSGRAVLTAALRRTESRGAHQRRDFPKRDTRWDCHITIRLDGNRGLDVRQEQLT